MIKDNKGFTLVELLATVVVIGVLILISVPNMVGVINKNKDSNYIDDARRMQSLAEYRFRTEDKDKIVNETDCILYTLNNLNRNQEFDKTPDNSGLDKESGVSDGKKYNFNDSFVVVKKDSKEYKYYVFLTTIDGKQKYANFTCSGADCTLFTGGDDDTKNYKQSDQKFDSSYICSKPIPIS